METCRFVFARPSGKRCFVVSSNGTTVSRLRNGSLLHRFPSALPDGAKTRDRSAQSYCILDCIFHEVLCFYLCSRDFFLAAVVLFFVYYYILSFSQPDQTYYVIDMVCWARISFYECTAEFRFFWMNSKLVESGACEAPSADHKYRFSLVPVF